MTPMYEQDMLKEIARLYFIEGEHQSVIAGRYGVSRSQISKLLKRCRAEGLVHITIHNADTMTKDLASQLKMRFSLRDVIIVPTGSPDVGYADTGKRVGDQAAAYLKSQLRNGMSLGIEWGTSLYHMIEQFRTDRTYDVDVYQMHGIIESSTLDVEGSALAKRLGNLLGGRAHLMQAPMLVESRELKELLVSERKIADKLEQAKHVDIACIGIGTNETGVNVLTRAGYLSEEESRDILRMGGTAMVSGWFIDRKGCVVQSSANERIIGVHPESFKSMDLVIGVAYGREKHQAICSALRGGYIHVLITDEETARGVLAEAETTREAEEIPLDTLLMIYERMIRVRKLDERLEQLFTKKALYGTTHLSIGQEASSVVPGCALEAQDQVFGTHRGHGHAVGRGMSSAVFMAELYGKKTGCAGGRGGSMHLVDVSKGIMGMNGVVAGALPIAVGAALSAKMKQENRVIAAFLGDGATNEGAFHEAMNLASVWKLPIMFLCENNLYGLSVHVKRSTGIDDLAARASAYGMPGCTIDGNDVIEIYHSIRRAREQVLTHGPVFIVMETYRISGHSKSDINAYRTQEEIDLWISRCPIKQFRKLLLRERLCSDAVLEQIDQQVAHEVRDAEHAAKRAEVPDTATLMEDVYACTNPEE